MREMLTNYPIQEGTIKIENALKKIYFRGVLPDFTNAQKKCFAIIGTRKATDYGKEQAFRFAKNLANVGLIIVSGMALGCDTFAHKGALDGNGKTIAVLGGGLSEKTIYPKENRKLSRDILEKGGALISEYPNNASPYPGNFLERNRIIAALSVGVLVIEAKLKSGALNTASWAKKQGKPIFALPGNINSPNSAGCNYLIQQGAFLTQTPKDILSFLKIRYDKQSAEKTQNKEGAIILKLLAGGALTADQIIEKTGLAPDIVFKTITQLEASDTIKNLFGNTYVANMLNVRCKI